MANKVLDQLTTATGELMTEDYSDSWYQVEKRHSLTASLALVSPEKTKLTESTIRCGTILEQAITVKATADSAIGDPTTTVDYATLVRVGQYIRNIRSGEVAHVTANAGTDPGALTITRGTLATTGGAAAAVITGDVWQLGPIPMAEGWSTLPASKILIPETETNRIQRFVEPIKITGTELRLMKNGSAKHKFLFKDVIAQAKRNLRLQMADSIVNAVQGTDGITGGLRGFAGTVDDGSSTFDMTDRKVFEPWLEEQASYCKGDKLMLPCGWEMWQSIHQLYQASSMSNQNEVLTKIGIRLKVLVSISGVDVVPYRERLLPSYTDAAGLTRGQAMTWEPNQVTWVPLSEIGIWDFAKDTGDNTTQYWMAEGGWRIKNAKSIRATKGILPVS